MGQQSSTGQLKTKKVKNREHFKNSRKH